MTLRVTNFATRHVPLAELSAQVQVGRARLPCRTCDNTDVLRFYYVPPAIAEPLTAQTHSSSASSFMSKGSSKVPASGSRGDRDDLHLKICISLQATYYLISFTAMTGFSQVSSMHRMSERRARRFFQ